MDFHFIMTVPVKYYVPIEQVLLSGLGSEVCTANFPPQSDCADKTAELKMRIIRWAAIVTAQEAAELAKGMGMRLATAIEAVHLAARMYETQELAVRIADALPAVMFGQLYHYMDGDFGLMVSSPFFRPLVQLTRSTNLWNAGTGFIVVEE